MKIYHAASVGQPARISDMHSMPRQRNFFLSDDRVRIHLAAHATDAHPMMAGQGMRAMLSRKASGQRIVSVDRLDLQWHEIQRRIVFQPGEREMHDA